MTRQKPPRCSVPNTTRFNLDNARCIDLSNPALLDGAEERPVTLSNRVLLEATAPRQEWDVLVASHLGFGAVSCRLLLRFELLLVLLCKNLRFENSNHHISCARIHLFLECHLILPWFGYAFACQITALLELLQSTPHATSPGTQVIYISPMFCDPVLKLENKLEGQKSHV
jgi:hypothetical protein